MVSAVISDKPAPAVQPAVSDLTGTRDNLPPVPKNNINIEIPADPTDQMIMALKARSFRMKDFSSYASARIEESRATEREIIKGMENANIFGQGLRHKDTQQAELKRHEATLKLREIQEAENITALKAAKEIEDAQAALEKAKKEGREPSREEVLAALKAMRHQVPEKAGIVTNAKFQKSIQEVNARLEEAISRIETMKKTAQVVEAGAISVGVVAVTVATAGVGTVTLGSFLAGTAAGTATGTVLGSTFAGVEEYGEVKVNGKDPAEAFESWKARTKEAAKTSAVTASSTMLGLGAAGKVSGALTGRASTLTVNTLSGATAAGTTAAAQNLYNTAERSLAAYNDYRAFVAENRNLTDQQKDSVLSQILSSYHLSPGEVGGQLAKDTFWASLTGGVSGRLAGVQSNNARTAANATAVGGISTVRAWFEGNLDKPEAVAQIFVDTTTADMQAHAAANRNIKAAEKPVIHQAEVKTGPHEAVGSNAETRSAPTRKKPVAEPPSETPLRNTPQVPEKVQAAMETAPVSKAQEVIAKLRGIEADKGLNKAPSIDVDDTNVNIDEALTALEKIENKEEWVKDFIESGIDTQAARMPAEVAKAAREAADKAFAPWSEHAREVSNRLLDGKISAEDIAFIRLVTDKKNWFPAAEKNGIRVPTLSDPETRILDAVSMEEGSSKAKPEEKLLQVWKTRSNAIESVRTELKPASTREQRVEMIDKLIGELADSLKNPERMNEVLVNLAANHALVSELTGRKMDTPESSVQHLNSRNMQHQAADYLKKFATRDFMVSYNEGGNLVIGMPVTSDSHGRTRLLDPSVPAERKVLEEVIAGNIEELIHCQQFLKMDEHFVFEQEKQHWRDPHETINKFGLLSDETRQYLMRTRETPTEYDAAELDALVKLMDLYKARGLPLELLHGPMYEYHPRARDRFVNESYGKPAAEKSAEQQDGVLDEAPGELHHIGKRGTTIRPIDNEILGYANNKGSAIDVMFGAPDGADGQGQFKRRENREILERLERRVVVDSPEWNQLLGIINELVEVTASHPAEGPVLAKNTLKALEDIKPSDYAEVQRRLEQYVKENQLKAPARNRFQDLAVGRKITSFELDNIAKGCEAAALRAGRGHNFDYHMDVNAHCGEVYNREHGFGANGGHVDVELPYGRGITRYRLFKAVVREPNGTTYDAILCYYKVNSAEHSISLGTVEMKDGAPVFGRDGLPEIKTVIMAPGGVGNVEAQGWRTPSKPGSKPWVVGDSLESVYYGR